jgi:hypothetical protein
MTYINVLLGKGTYFFFWDSYCFHLSINNACSASYNMFTGAVMETPLNSMSVAIGMHIKLSVCIKVVDMPTVLKNLASLVQKSVQYILLQKP